MESAESARSIGSLLANGQPRLVILRQGDPYAHTTIRYTRSNGCDGIEYGVADSFLGLGLAGDMAVSAVADDGADTIFPSSIANPSTAAGLVSTDEMLVNTSVRINEVLFHPLPGGYEWVETLECRETGQQASMGTESLMEMVMSTAYLIACQMYLLGLSWS